MRPRFEIISGTADAEERRLVSVETFRTMTGVSDSDLPDESVEALIDAVLAQCASYCGLARAGSAPLTFAEEGVRATWLANHRHWYHQRIGYIVLPWRAPITSITVTEGSAQLEENVDYQLLGAGVVERIGGSCWAFSSPGIVVDYTAGWIAGDEENPMPSDVVARVCDQVKLMFDQRSAPRNLRSEDVVGIWSGTYSVPGGDSISSSGLIMELEAALMPYRAPPSFG